MIIATARTILIVSTQTTPSTQLRHFNLVKSAENIESVLFPRFKIFFFEFEFESIHEWTIHRPSRRSRYSNEILVERFCFQLLR